MEEKIYQLIKERNPWLLKDSFLSKTIYTLLKKYLRYDETVFVGDHIQSMTGEEAFNWLGSEYTSNSSVEGLENIPKDGKFLIVSNHPMGAADAIALYHTIYPVRNDLFFFANELFVYLLGAFHDLLAPVVWNKEKETHSANKVTLERLSVFLVREGLVLFFLLVASLNLLFLVYGIGLGRRLQLHSQKNIISR